ASGCSAGRRLPGPAPAAVWPPGKRLDSSTPFPVSPFSSWPLPAVTPPAPSRGPFGHCCPTLAPGGAGWPPRRVGSPNATGANGGEFGVAERRRHGRAELERDLRKSSRDCLELRGELPLSVLSWVDVSPTPRGA